MTRPRPAACPLPALAAVLGLALQPGAAAADDPGDLELLTEWTTGTFSSAVQAAENPEFLDVVLETTPIWTDRPDGPWLYVEQAVRVYRDRPYRQRVYRVRELVPGLFEIRVFTLPDPAAAVGAWRLDQPLADLGPADLVERDGCAILLRRRGDAFIGSTLGSLCTSTLRDASYATSEVVITPDGMVSWDRGFAADGSQVWGSTAGGYVFDRIVDDSGAGAETEPDAGTGSGTGSETEAGAETGTETGPGAGTGAEAEAGVVTFELSRGTA